ncbi:MAG: zinc-ribbon domain-containing protein [Myxococcaceae bacterium]
MIVKCEQCQTRFKIPDDKVTDKGVKVRCTKCGHTFRVTRDMAQPATATVPAVQVPPQGADPFAKFGASPELPPNEVTRPGVFALGVEATRSPDLGARQAPGVLPPSYPTAPSIPAATAHTSSSPFDFSSLKPPEPSMPTQPAVPAFKPAAAPPAPFDFSAIAPPTAGGPAPAAAPSAFDFSSFAAPVGPPQAQPPPPPPPSAPTSPTTPALPAFDFGPPSAPAPVAAPPPRPRSSAPLESMTQQMSSLPDAAGGADGFFASTDSSASAISNLDGATARSMFDLPQAPAHQETLPDIPPPEPDPVPSPVAAAPAPVSPAAAVARAAPSKEGEGPAGEEPPRRRSVVGIIVNIGIAAVLVFGLVVVGSAYLNEGKLSADSLSLDSLKNTFAPSVEFVATDVSNGLYETRAGRSVFFVRGEVTNHSGNAVKIVVKAELVEDGKVLRAAESWVGDPATPEEIFLIDGAESLDALGRRVEKRAMTIPAEAAGTFVVLFTEYPPDLKEFRVRVSARAVAGTPTADAR